MTLKTYLAQRRGLGVELAKAIAVSPSAICMWATGARRVPADMCLVIEHATRGLVKADELRPDLIWSRVVQKEKPHATRGTDSKS